MPSKPPVLVVGAGITGLSAAWLLTRAGHSVEIHEASSDPGGLLAPIEFKGLPCDQGSHRIHPSAHPLLMELTRDAGWQERPRRGRLVLDHAHMQYPLQMADFLRGLGPKTALHMGLNFLTRPGAMRRFKSWENDRQDARTDIGFEDFVTARVGRRAYRQFYAPYVQKVWGLHPSEISQTVAKARVSTASPASTLKKALRKEATIDGHFLYPNDGMAGLIDYFMTGLELAGVPVHFGRTATAETLDAWDGPIVFSGHLSHLAPEAGLQHRGLYILHAALPKGTVGDTDTFYLPEADYWFGRVSQPAQFSSELSTETHDVICMEVPEGKNGPDIDFSTQLGTLNQQLQAANIIGPGVEIEELKQTFLPRVYPLYTRGWLDRWRQALNTVSAMERVFPIGRQGLYLHCNIDHCVHIADECVQLIEGGGTAQQWLDSVDRFLELRVRD